MVENNEQEKLYWERMSRQIQILGKEGQAKIAAIKVAVIGCGGNGGIIAFLCALIGVLKLILVDPDKIELHNLNRFALGSVRNVGEYKVAAAKNNLEKSFRDIKVEAIAEDVRTLGVWDRVKGCNWVFDALDNDESRHFVNDKCVTDGIPFASVASGFVIREGRVITAVSRANRVKRGDACLEHQTLDEQSMEQSHVSLVIPNMIAANLGVNMMLRDITGYHSAGLKDESRNRISDDKNFILFDLLSMRLTAERILPSPGCPYCQKLNEVKRRGYGGV